MREREENQSVNEIKVVLVGVRAHQVVPVITLLPIIGEAIRAEWEMIGVREFTSGTLVAATHIFHIFIHD